MEAMTTEKIAKFCILIKLGSSNRLKLTGTVYEA
jgi:hypothetical protein